MTKTRGKTAKAGKPTDIIAAMNGIFKPWFAGDTWSGWQSILKAAYALPMTDSEIQFFRSVAERDPPRQRVRELWIIAGRRAGKDSIASLIAAHSAALFTDGDRLRPGERAMVMCLAVDKDQARIILGYTKSYFQDIPALKSLVQRTTASGFELTNKVDVSVLTSSFRAVRGRPVLCAVLDEVAFLRDETSATPDVELFKALEPATATLSSSMIIGISSPWKKSGLLFEKFKKHYGQDSDDVLVIRAPTRTLNPCVPQALIDRALEEDPAAAKAEWMAEWRADVDAWLSLELIEAAVDNGVAVRPPNPKKFVYHAGIDPSGGSKDSYTAAISHAEGNEIILDALLEIRPPFDPAVATEQVVALLRSYGLSTCTGDRYAAQWVVSAFAKLRVTYRHSDRDRSQIYNDALPLFTSGRAKLLDNRRLVNQFAGLESKASSLGKVKTDHGPNGKDDACNAAALSMVLASKTKRPLFIAPLFIATGGPNVARAFDMGLPADRFDFGGGSMEKPGGTSRG